MLVDKGAEVNKADDDGLTPLHRSARKGNVEMVSLLVANGADLNVKDRWVGDDGGGGVVIAVVVVVVVVVTIVVFIISLSDTRSFLSVFYFLILGRKLIVIIVCFLPLDRS